MVERGTGHPENQTGYKLQLATKLAQTSDLLSILFPEKQSAVWHVISPQFRHPSIYLKGRDISGQLYKLSQYSEEFYVSLHHMSGEYDGNCYNPPTDIWEVHPPICSSFMGRFRSDCHQGVDLPGLGITVFIPRVGRILTLEELKVFTQDGYLSVDLPSWSRGDEFFYDRTKPESVLMEMVGQDPLAGLETALWILDSLWGAKEIHPEQITFELQKI